MVILYDYVKSHDKLQNVSDFLDYYKVIRNFDINVNKYDIKEYRDEIYSTIDDINSHTMKAALLISKFNIRNNYDNTLIKRVIINIMMYLSKEIRIRDELLISFQHYMTTLITPQEIKIIDNKFSKARRVRKYLVKFYNNVNSGVDFNITYSTFEIFQTYLNRYNSLIKQFFEFVHKRGSLR